MMIILLCVPMTALLIIGLVRVCIEPQLRNAKFLDEHKQEDFFGQELYDEPTELSDRETEEFKENEDDNDGNEIVPREIIDKLINDFYLD